MVWSHPGRGAWTARLCCWTDLSALPPEISRSARFFQASRAGTALAARFGRRSRFPDLHLGRLQPRTLVLAALGTGGNSGTAGHDRRQGANSLLSGDNPRHRGWSLAPSPLAGWPTEIGRRIFRRTAR